jgi:hypothetical protein
MSQNSRNQGGSGSGFVSGSGTLVYMLQDGLGMAVRCPVCPCRDTKLSTVSGLREHLLSTEHEANLSAAN